MQKEFIKKGLAAGAAVLFFLILSYGFLPQLFQGKVLNQGDTTAWRAMSKEASDYNKTHKDEALWTNSMFGGMPTVTINKITTGNHILLFDTVLNIGKAPASHLFISLLGGFLLFLALGISIPLAAAGAVAITFCSYNLQIIQAGHVTKMVALAYTPWVLASLAYMYRKNALLGALFLAITVSLQVAANHPQITYYLGYLILAILIGLLIQSIKERTVPKFAKTTLLVVVAGLLGMATSAGHLLPTYEYTKESMRGGTELAVEDSPRKGLDIDYATQWSYSRKESFNMLIPNFMGGSSSGPLSKDSKTYDKLKQMGYNADALISHMPLYWGEQPFTAGPMYMGAILLFLFLLGLLLIKGPLKWALAGVSVLALLLSWGYHLEWFSLFFFKYVPLYDKFRTVSMFLVVWQFTLPLLGVYTVWKILEGNFAEAALRKKLYIAGGITAGLCLLLALVPSLAGPFSGPADAQFPQGLIPALIADRKNLLRADALRSAALILAAGLVLHPVLRKRLKPAITIAALGLLLLIDYLPVGKRYLNDSHFVSSNQYKSFFAERPVDNYILQDTDLYYRTLDLTGNTFSDATAAYFHKSVGGYNAAKLQRYQEIIDHHLLPEIQSFATQLNQCRTLEEAAEIFACHDDHCYTPVLNLLNTKYTILAAEALPVTNPYALGNAWVVERILPVDSPLEELEALAHTDLRTTAVMQRPPAAWLDAAPAAAASAIPADTPAAAPDNAPPAGQLHNTASAIQLTAYSPNALEYHAVMETDGVVVFSEIFYPKGWKAYIDEEEVPILRSNYITRTLLVPAGQHHIRFTYKPACYTTGVLVSRISSLGLLAALLAAIVLGVIRLRLSSGTLQKKKDTEK
ncbi:MAG: YfhO family protein [Bacteroidales bacterium]|jgi:hypothetical protein